MPVTELLNLENLRQFSSGMNVLLPFSIDLAPTTTPINNGDDWEVRIVKPRGGGMIIKTSGLTFRDNAVQEISMPIDALDFDRNGTYFYQVIKTTSGKQIKSDVREFEVKPSLPTGLPIPAPTSPSEGYFPYYNAQGQAITSGLQAIAGVLYFNGSRVAVLNGTQHAIPFFGASSAMTQNDARFKYENTTNQERFFVSGRMADGAFRLEFDGWNGSAYTTGMYIKATNAGAYFSKLMELENTSYATKFHVHLAFNNWYFSNEMTTSAYVFDGFYGNYVPFRIDASSTLSGYARILARSFATTEVVAEFRGYAGQTANIWEYRNSSNSVVTALTASGALTIITVTADSQAPNSTIFWNSTDSKLRFKNPAGTSIDLH